MNSISLDLIRMDGGTQPRAVINFDVVEAYTESMESGAKFPPIDVFFDGSVYWLADGFHRVKGAYGAGLDEIACRVHQGTLEDAQWFSIAANQTNGLYRSNADKQRAIEAALRHPKSRGLSDREIGRHVGVSAPTVAAVRAKVTVKVLQSTAQEISKPETRTGRDGRTINTANIGKKQSVATVVERREEVVTATAPMLDAGPLVWACDAIAGIVKNEGPQNVAVALTKEQLKSVEEAHEFLASVIRWAANN